MRDFNQTVVAIDTEDFARPDGICDVDRNRTDTTAHVEYAPAGPQKLGELPVIARQRAATKNSRVRLMRLRLQITKDNQLFALPT